MKKCYVTSGGSANNNNKVERKIVEKNRRIHMKSLCFKLSSLLPNDQYYTNNPTMDVLSQHDHLDNGASYIKQLRERIERLKQRKKKLAAMGEGSENHKVQEEEEVASGVRLPVVEVRHLDSILEVVVITGLKKSFMFYEVVGVLEEEGAEVVNASFSVVNDKILYTIHSQAVSSRIGFEASTVSERLNELIHCEAH